MTDAKNQRNTDILRKQVVDYLHNHRYNDELESKPTHCAWGSVIKGKFVLNKEEIKTFTDLYINAINNGVDNLTILEIQQDYSPIIIDIDLKIPIDNYKKNTRLYNNEMIKNIIKNYITIINEYLKMPEQISICLFEKQYPTESDDICKDGFHIYIPEIITSTTIRHLIRDRVVKLYSHDNLFEEFIEIPDKIIDKSVVSANGWLLPGSRKPTGQVYKLTRIYNKDLQIIHNQMDLDTAYDNEKIIKYFSLNIGKRNLKKYATLVKDSWTESELDAEIKKNNLNMNIKPNDTIFNNTKDKEEVINQASAYIDMLSNYRFDNYEDWRNIGLAAHNTDDSLLYAWIEKSKTSKKYNEGECERYWKTFKSPSTGNLLTIKSLAYWAKIDSPKEFETYNKTFFKSKLKDSLDNNTYSLAIAFKAKYGDRFVCTSQKSNEWYEYKNHKWEYIEDAYTMRILFSEDFANEYYEEVIETTKLITKVQGYEKENLQSKLNILTKITEKLKNVDFKNKLINEAKSIFYDPNFYDKLDSNLYLLGFNNGVYDAIKGEFRDGMYDDYISLSTKHDYRPYSDHMPYKKEIDNFFNQVIPDEDVRDFLLTAFSTCITGETKEEKLYILTGSGSNSKSVSVELMGLALGDYFMSCPITIITKKRGSSNETSPEKVRMKGRRLGAFQETDDGERLNVGVMKEFTGGDKILVRDLFKGSKEMIEFKPQIKYFLICNTLPEVPSNDDGTWRRLRVIDFKSKFTDNPTKPNEYKINTNLKHEIKKWAPYLLSYMIHIYETKYKNINYLKEPKEVLASTNRYKMENDYYTEYFMEKLIITTDPKNTISRDNLYNDFKNWYKNANDFKIVPKKLEFEKSINKLIGDPTRRGYIKVVFANKIEESISDNDNLSSLDQ